MLLHLLTALTSPAGYTKDPQFASHNLEPQTPTRAPTSSQRYLVQRRIISEEQGLAAAAQVPTCSCQLKPLVAGGLTARFGLAHPLETTADPFSTLTAHLAGLSVQAAFVAGCRKSVTNGSAAFATCKIQCTGAFANLRPIFLPAEDPDSHTPPLGILVGWALVSMFRLARPFNNFAPTKCLERLLFQTRISALPRTHCFQSRSVSHESSCQGAPHSIIIVLWWPGSQRARRLVRRAKCEDTERPVVACDTCAT
ncbi:hypothetical protein NLG97_g7460 [Lecanicillium saksenae]|uniref:Uncharacterized protein n=1 Tax=Lecanicillium saksenae TaxID=468837 RepID=A0ACC1QPQ0_9HYPO|nr:hypothetical protein NLG97_g7460 [Lecanicillium saksenae]